MIWVIFINTDVTPLNLVISIKGIGKFTLLSYSVITKLRTDKPSFFVARFSSKKYVLYIAPKVLRGVVYPVRGFFGLPRNSPLKSCKKSLSYRMRMHVNLLEIC